jgi:hypothetical protein
LILPNFGGIFDFFLEASLAEILPMSRQFAGRFWMINEDEDAALEYLPHRDQVLYLRGIKPHLDMATGLVGVARRLSYKGMAELLEEHRARGSTVARVSISKQAVRECIKRLSGAGLLDQVRSGERAEWLVFRLPLAHVVSVRPHEEQRRNNTPGTTQLKPVVAGVLDVGATQEQHTMNNTHQEIKNINNSTNVESPKPSVSDAGVSGVDLDLQPVDQVGVGQSGLGNCPHAEILDLWAEVLPMCKQPKRALWSQGVGATNLGRRWRQAAGIQHSAENRTLYHDRESGLLWWRQLFVYIATRCPLLTSDETKWFDLRWLVKKENFLKTLDKKYEG